MEEMFSDTDFEISLWWSTKHFNFFSSAYVEGGNLLNLHLVQYVCILKCNFLLFNSLLQHQVLKNVSTIAQCSFSWKISDGLLKNPVVWVFFNIFLHFPIFFTLMDMFPLIPSKTHCSNKDI